MKYPLYPFMFGEGSGITGAIAYLSNDVELNDIHIKAIIEAHQMTMEWALSEDEDHVKGWNPWKWG